MGVMAVRGMGDGMRRTETAHDCICQVARGLEGVLGKETKSGSGDISSEQGTLPSAESVGLASHKEEALWSETRREEPEEDGPSST